MRTVTAIVTVAGFLVCTAIAAGPSPLAKVYDGQLASAEHEIVPLAEAMPDNKYEFAPTSGAFTGVRTYRQQVTHIATIIYMLSAASRQEKMPVEVGTLENGPASITNKAQAVQFLKDAFAYGHQAMLALTPENQMGMVKSPFGPGEMARASLVATMLSHNLDHYGQMVVYARMNGVIPPASQPRPPAGKR